MTPLFAYTVSGIFFVLGAIAAVSTACGALSPWAGAMLALTQFFFCWVWFRLGRSEER